MSETADRCFKCGQWMPGTFAKRAKAALQAKRSRGEYCGGKVPYGYLTGYMTSLNEKQQILPNPVEQVVVRKVQELARSGVTYRTIADVLEVDGHKTRAGKKFQPGQIARIVHSPAVLG